MSPSRSSTSFEDLYERYYRAVVSVFLRRGFTLEEARDLAQTTFVRVYENWKDYRGEAKWSYLLATANRVGHNEIRYRQAERRRGETTSLRDDTDHLPHLAETNLMTGERPPSAAEQILEKEKTRQIREAMAELDPEELRYLGMWIGGRKYKEIMAVEQVTMDTVKSKLYRAKRKLKEKVQQKLGDANLDWPETKDDER